MVINALHYCSDLGAKEPGKQVSMAGLDGIDQRASLASIFNALVHPFSQQIVGDQCDLMQKNCGANGSDEIQPCRSRHDISRCYIHVTLLRSFRVQSEKAADQAEDRRVVEARSAQRRVPHLLHLRDFGENRGRDSHQGRSLRHRRLPAHIVRHHRVERGVELVPCVDVRRYGGGVDEREEKACGVLQDVDRVRFQIFRPGNQTCLNCGLEAGGMSESAGGKKGIEQLPLAPHMRRRFLCSMASLHFILLHSSVHQNQWICSPPEASILSKLQLPVNGPLIMAAEMQLDRL